MRQHVFDGHVGQGAQGGAGGARRGEDGQQGVAAAAVAQCDCTHTFGEVCGGLVRSGVTVLQVAHASSDTAFYRYVAGESHFYLFKLKLRIFVLLPF